MMQNFLVFWRICPFFLQSINFCFIYTSRLLYLMFECYNGGDFLVNWNNHRWERLSSLYSLFCPNFDLHLPDFAPILLLCLCMLFCFRGASSECTACTVINLTICLLPEEFKSFTFVCIFSIIILFNLNLCHFFLFFLLDDDKSFYSIS